MISYLSDSLKLSSFPNPNTHLIYINYNIKILPNYIINSIFGFGKIL